METRAELGAQSPEIFQLVPESASASSPSTLCPRSRATSVSVADLEYSVVPYPQRIEEILEVRRVARCAARQNAPETLAGEMLDRCDLAASMAIAEHEGRIVGTMRMTRPLDDTILHPTNRYLGPIVGLPHREDYLELSRACVHPDYQGHGILWHLTAQMLIAARAAGKTYLLGGATEQMVRFWKRCGFRQTETIYRIPTAPGVDHYLIVLEIEEVLSGRGIDPKLARALSAWH